MKRPALILICLLLQACSATTKELGNSLWDSLFGTPGVQLTDDDIQNMPYASQYMQLNGGPQLFVVLAFAEDGQQKWVTQDQATLVTQHGRLVKTLLGGDNLIEVNNLAADPLIKPAQIVDGATWTRTMGWTEYQQVRYATARSVFNTPPHAQSSNGMAPIPSKSAAMKPRFACWTKKSPPTRRAGITATGSTAKGKFASRNSISARIISR